MARSTLKPEEVALTVHDFDELMERVRSNTLSDEDLANLEAVGKSYFYLLQQIKDKRTRMKDLRALLLESKKTEKTAEVLKRNGLDSETSASDGAEPASSDAGEPSSGDDEGEPASPSALPGSTDDAVKQGEDGSKPKRKGHGRNGADAYVGAEPICVDHESLKPGDRCPRCGKGRLYEQNKPKTLVRIVGQAPLTAKVCRCQRLRCNLCGDVYTAAVPEEFAGAKYDPSCGVTIAMMKYGTGMPFYRLARLQKSVGVPMPAGTQWEVVKPLVKPAKSVHGELVRQAAQGTVLHNDDTSVRVAELAKEIEEEAKKSTDKESGAGQQRTGMFTTGVVAEVDGRQIALFFTGRQHAGENLTDVLRHRQPELGPPIQMCDALDRNLPKEFEVILANCAVHGRRQFVNVIDSFPQECHHVLEALGQVFKLDADAKRDGLTPEQRLALHQEHSKPVMDELHEWMSSQLDDKLAEPNSGLGKAIRYMLKRWDELTLFLRQAGAPLSNNICERALKKAVLHRKNALFYKTKNGAEVGDIFMSLIHTCELAGINPFDYLTELSRHPEAVAHNPRDWLPWTYRDTLQNMNTAKAA